MWAFELPWALVEAHLAAMPALRAEEALLASAASALGAGTLKARDAKALRSSLERQAGQFRRARLMAREGLQAAPPRAARTKGE